MLQVVGEAHKDALLSMSGLNRSLHILVTDLRRVCEEVHSSTHRCLRAIDHASSLLQQSFINHQQACRCALALLPGHLGLRSSRLARCFYNAQQLSPFHYFSFLFCLRIMILG